MLMWLDIGNVHMMCAHVLVAIDVGQCRGCKLLNTVQIELHMYM